MPPQLNVERAKKIAFSRFKGVYMNETTGQFLHYNGDRLTRNRNHAWFGNRTQLRVMRRQSPLTFDGFAFVEG